ncbi:tetratricopeptide repeat protein [Campylobacter showae]|uniref:tetratricopeptide repeat protein n=1 Tax=Campylobacter showae TaxID=204 RepID=UPI001E5371B0|nr:tetratricopeptide repeat protein [Campylobacter showae]
MRKILIFLLPIWLFGTSCEEAIELSAEEFIKPDRNATATALASERAVQICLAEYGEEHESTIIALNNSGSFFMFAGEPQKALAAYERSLKILQKGLGKEHKALAKPYHGVAIAQSALGRYDEAIANFGAAIRCYELGGEKMQKDLMSCYAGLGDTLYKMGDFNGAYVKHAVAFRIYEEVFGADSVNLLRAKYYALMAGDLAGLGNKTEALQNYEKALKVANKILEKSSDKHAKSLKAEVEAKIKEL